MIDANKLIMLARLTFDIPAPEPRYVASIARLLRALDRTGTVLSRPHAELWPEIIGDEEDENE